MKTIILTIIAACVALNHVHAGNAEWDAIQALNNQTRTNTAAITAINNHPPLTNGTLVIASGTNTPPSTNVNQVWVSIATNAPGKIFIGRSGQWRGLDLGDATNMPAAQIIDAGNALFGNTNNFARAFYVQTNTATATPDGTYQALSISGVGTLTIPGSPPIGTTFKISAFVNFIDQADGFKIWVSTNGIGCFTLFDDGGGVSVGASDNLLETRMTYLGGGLWHVTTLIIMGDLSDNNSPMFFHNFAAINDAASTTIAAPINDFTIGIGVTVSTIDAASIDGLIIERIR